MGHNKKDYIPTGKSDFSIWTLKFSKKVTKNVGKHGITDKMDADLKKLANDLVNGYTREDELIEAKRKQVKLSQINRAAAIDESRLIAQVIKNDPTYTNAVGVDFDIIGAEVIFDPKTFKPILTLRHVSNGVEVSFEKSETDGINLYRRVEGEEVWRYMARDTHSPYIDTKKMDDHASYEYMAWAVIKDKEIGLESDTAKITV